MSRLQDFFPRLASLFVLPLVFVATSTVVAQLSPEAELATLKAEPPLEVSLFACEPLVTNPAAIDVDTHGRVWVAEIEWYRSGAKTPPADKIKVLEDTDGDGRADKVTVFAEGLFAPMSICVAGDRVFVATSPDLWVFEDKNGDLKADGLPKKLLTGFQGYNHDHGAHSLVLGPDHCWWMSHGDTGFDVHGTDGSHVQFQWGAVLRGELDGSRLETVAVNFRNPYEVCVSSFGEAFLSDNDNDGNESVRICWIMEGGNYGWFGGPPFGKQELAGRLSADTPFREHWHFRGHVPGFVPATLVTGFGSPTGICFYEGDAFGPDYKNVPLHTDCGPRECRAYPHELSGFGMRAKSKTILSNSGDNYFRPDDICAAPDGRLYVSDWYDGGVGGHGYNNPEQGRIFALMPQGKRLARREKPGPYSNTADAIEGLKSPNLATQFLARERLLADGAKSIPALKELLSDSELNDAARALWVLDRIGGDGRTIVSEQLKHTDSRFRALAVRILRRHQVEYAGTVLAMANDDAPEVRREVLLAIRVLSGEQAAAALAKIATSYDGSDRYLLEAINIAAVERKRQLLARLEKQRPLTPQQFPLLQVLAPERAAREVLSRLSSTDLDEREAKILLHNAANIPSPDAGWGLLNIVANASAPATLRPASLQAVLANVQHRGAWESIVEGPKFSAALGELLNDHSLRGAAMSAAGRLQLRGLGERVLAVALSGDNDPAEREQAAIVATRLRPPAIGQSLEKLLTDPEPRVAKAALRGVVELQDVRQLREILCQNKFDDATRRSTADQLATSVGGALVLLRLIEQDALPDDLESRAIAKAIKHPDSNIRVLYEKFIPADERPKRLGEAIAADDILKLTGDSKRGREIFDKSSAAQCKSCHAVQGFGGSLGPELTNIGKKYERRALLETIIEPSKAIAPEFVPYVLETTSGQVYAGFLVEHNANGVVLKDVKGQLVRVAAGEIESLAAQPKSLMPELILSQLTAQDAADLLAFLTTLQ